MKVRPLRRLAVAAKPAASTLSDAQKAFAGVLAELLVERYLARGVDWTPTPRPKRKPWKKAS